MYIYKETNTIQRTFEVALIAIGWHEVLEFACYYNKNINLNRNAPTILAYIKYTVEHLNGDRLALPAALQFFGLVEDNNRTQLVLNQAYHIYKSIDPKQVAKQVQMFELEN